MTPPERRSPSLAVPRRPRPTAGGRPGGRLGGRSGLTLVELLVALAVAAVLAAAGVRAAARAHDSAAVRAAGTELRGSFAAARALAVRRAARTAVRLDTLTGAATVHAGSDTLRRLALAARFGVRLTAATRDSMAYSALGLGHGAANLRVVVARGHAADTVVVSRLGRVR